MSESQVVYYPCNLDKRPTSGAVVQVSDEFPQESVDVVFELRIPSDLLIEQGGELWVDWDVAMAHPYETHA